MCLTTLNNYIFRVSNFTVEEIEMLKCLARSSIWHYFYPLKIGSILGIERRKLIKKIIRKKYNVRIKNINYFMLSCPENFEEKKLHSVF